MVMIGFGVNAAEAVMKNLKSLEERSPKAPVQPAKYAEKATKGLSAKCSPRRIQQPRKTRTRACRDFSL